MYTLGHKRIIDLYHFQVRLPADDVMFFLIAATSTIGSWTGVSKQQGEQKFRNRCLEKTRWQILAPYLNSVAKRMCLSLPLKGWVIKLTQGNYFVFFSIDLYHFHVRVLPDAVRFFMIADTSTVIGP